MGIQGGESSDVDGTGVDAFGAEQETQFVQDIDITFTMSGTADNGLTFGAAIDLDEDAGDVGTDDAGVAIFVSGEWGTLTLGDTDGALDWAMQGVALAGSSINDNETSHAGFRESYLDGSEDGQILRYDYSFGDFGIAISIEQDDDGPTAVDVSPYSFGGLAGWALAQPQIYLGADGGTVFVDAAGNVDFGSFGAGAPPADFLGGTFPAGANSSNAVYAQGVYDIEALDFDLNGDNVLDIVDGDGATVVDALNGTSFADGRWLGHSVGGTTAIGVMNTILELNQIEATGNFAPTADADDRVTDYFISVTDPLGTLGDYNADVLGYVDNGDDYQGAIGLTYSFDTGMGELTVGGGYQQGGTIYATRLWATAVDPVAGTVGTAALVANGTDLTEDPTPGNLDDGFMLSESIIGHRQSEWGISATYAMTNGFSAGFQYSHIENADARSYRIAINNAGTDATVTNALFTDATHWGIGAAYEFDAITVAANYGQLDYDHAAFPDQSGYGLVGQYDFGGGLSAHLGYGYSERGNDSASNWSFGLSMSF